MQILLLTKSARLGWTDHTTNVAFRMKFVRMFVQFHTYELRKLHIEP